MAYPDAMKERTKQLYSEMPEVTYEQIVEQLRTELPGLPKYPNPRQIGRWVNPADKAKLPRKGKTVRDPLIMEKRRDHEALLVSGLRSLRPPPLEFDLSNYCWDWSSGEPRKRAEEALISYLARPDTSRPDTLGDRCLLNHLEEEDPVLVNLSTSEQVLRSYRQLCSSLYGELVDGARKVAMEVGDVPLLSFWRLSASLEQGFVDSLFKISGHLCSGYFGDQEVKYGTGPFGEDEQQQFSALHFGERRLFIGPEHQCEKVNAAHRDLHVQLRQHKLLQEVKRKREEYECLADSMDQAIKVKILQRVFLPGPCEVCAPWGGLG